MSKWRFWMNSFLEFVWNKTVVLQFPIKYRLSYQDQHRVVTQWLMIGDRRKKFIFSSQQISYHRQGSLFKSTRDARLYRVVVIEESANVGDEKGSPSQVYFVPELCSSLLRHTLIPHSCAINFIIHKLLTTIEVKK